MKNYLLLIVSIVMLRQQAVGQHLVPLNLGEALSLINEHKSSGNHLSTLGFKAAIDLNRLWYDQLSSQWPQKAAGVNISAGCVLQIDQLRDNLKNHSDWALKGC